MSEIVRKHLTLHLRMSLHQLGRTNTGIAIAALIWGFLEMTTLLVVASIAVPYGLRGDADLVVISYDDTIWLIGIFLTVGLPAFMGYLLQEERSGFLALLISQTITFPPVFWIFVQLNLEPLVVPILALVVFFLGALAVLGGSLLRDRTFPFWRVGLDWRFLAVALLLDTIAIFWPITAPFPRGYTQGSFHSFNWVVPVRLGDLAFPIMAVLVGVSLFLVLLGLRRPASTSFATLPILIGSVIVSICGVISYRFTLFAGYPGLSWLVLVSLAAPAIGLLGIITVKKIRLPSVQEYL